MNALSTLTGQHLSQVTRNEYEFCELERKGLERFVIAHGDTVKEFQTDKGSTRVITMGGYVVSANGYISKVPASKVTLSVKSARAVQKYGLDECIKAYAKNQEGYGASTIAFENRWKTNQADAAINAGQEYIVFTTGHELPYGRHTSEVTPLENLPTAQETPEPAINADVQTLVAAYKTDGKGYMLAKYRDICESRNLKFCESAALIDTVWSMLVPGNDKVARLERMRLIKA